MMAYKDVRNGTVVGVILGAVFVLLRYMGVIHG